MEPLKVYLKKIPKVKLIRGFSMGVAINRNFGYSNAVGPVIITVRNF